MTYTLLSSQTFTGNFISPVLTMPSGVSEARAQITLSNVDWTASTVIINLERSIDGGLSWTTIATASIQPPAVQNRKDSNVSDFAIFAPSGMFRVSSNIVGSATVQVTVSTTP